MSTLGGNHNYDCSLHYNQFKLCDLHKNVLKVDGIHITVMQLR